MTHDAVFVVALVDGSRRLARGVAGDGPTELLPAGASLDAALGVGGGGLAALLTETGDGPVPDGATLQAPLESQEVWASGVTYERSLAARAAESREPDVYDRVYDAPRPELFFKAPAWRVRGSGQPIGVRVDSIWDVPEPELGVVFDARGGIAGLTICNDASSRSIEGENPLYLPQAKFYDGAAAVGPALVAVDDADAERDIVLTIERDGGVVSEDRTSTGRLHRGLDELGRWLFAATSFPHGVVLSTGTGIVPADDFTLQPGDVVRITIDGLGTLVNPVEQVGRSVA